jgi:hypothetical protein
MCIHKIENANTLTTCENLNEWEAVAYISHTGY